MSTLLERPVKVSRIITTSASHARAIEDPARARMLVMLYRRSMSAEQISDGLRKAGNGKALTTVRHHLDVLKASGLVEVVRMEEARGAVTKFYGTSTRLLGYDVPDDFESRYSKQIKSVTSRMEKILRSLEQKTDPPKQKDGGGEGYSQYLMMEIMNRAATRVLEGAGTE